MTINLHTSAIKKLSVCFYVFTRTRKILNLRLFEDDRGQAWSQSVMEKELEVLCVSQFTLQCVLKGNKPDFHLAMSADFAQDFYNNIVEQMRSTYKPELIKGKTAMRFSNIMHRGFILN